MKRIFKIPILILLTFSNLIINAQFSKNNALYLKIGASLGNYSGTDINVNYIYKQTYSLQIRQLVSGRASENVPSNYHSGNILGKKGSKPYELLIANEVLFGKVYSIDKKAHIRAQLKLGVSYNIFEIPSNFIPKSNDNGWGNIGIASSSNYDYEIIKKKKLGLVINPNLEFSFWRGFGVSIAPYVNINSERIAFAGQIAIMAGILRPK